MASTEDLERPPQIGPYRVLSVLGQGGAATVYLAAAAQMPGRRVALKVLRTGDLEAGEVARFRHELAALSAMAHTNVAAVFDAGIWEGRPYFVLEWVADGVPLPEFCLQHRVPLRGRLELFLQACAGVQHAHERGHLHCDITPRNLLVAGGASPIVKVIDFGLARALGTAEGAPKPGISGTVAYLAPEQVVGAGDLDVRVDVHALGLVLFELLSGRRARGADAFAAKDLPGQLQLAAVPVRDRPSDVAAPDAGIDRRALRGPLDWIVGKALAGDRAARFASVAELADDLRRHLAGLAVLAGPSPWGYRLRAWALQHRSVLASSLLVLGSLLAGTAAAAVVARNAQQAAAVADLARRESERQLARFELLADAARLRQAIDDADRLWPAAPELVPAIDRWRSEQVDPLIARMPLYRTALAELVAIGAPLAVADHPERSPFHPVGHVLARVALWREVLTSSDPATQAALASLAPEQIAHYRRALEVYERDAIERAPGGMAPSVRAPNDRDETLLRELTALVDGLVALQAPEGLLTSMAARRERAATVRQLTVEGDSAALAWQQVQRRLREDPRFRDVTLAPQVGLLPLGRDGRSGLEEFAHVDSGAVPHRDARGDLVLAQDHCIVLVLLPPAHTHVGAQATDPDGLHYDPQAHPSEGPVRAIDVPPWFVSKYELSVEQARRYAIKPDIDPRADAPSLRFTLELAEAYVLCCGLELLSEDVWEYACRGGTSTPWWTGADPRLLSANREQPAAANIASLEFGPTPWPGEADVPLHRDGHRSAAPVSALRPSPFGLHSVHGNAMELCHGRKGAGVLCGGAYNNGAWMARSTCRIRVETDSNMFAPTLRLGRRVDR